jgi:hypothetical protein
MYQLASDKSEQVKQWLDEMVIVIDPCENPDGRDRYANWYRQKQSLLPNTSSDAWEKDEPFPGGRFNHYLFDLNRDWVWQTQKESQERVKLYQDYMPHVHVDLHEMGYNSPYYFAPAAKPYHEDLTAWQRKFQEYLGENNAKYFHKNNQLYYTKEVFDLFYPSYGDTYPIFNGAIGFTFEQGGSGRAGVGIETESGQVLTLKQRLLNHYYASFSTIEITYKHRKMMLEEFKKFFEDAKNPKGQYKSYVIKYKNQEAKALALTKLMDKQKIDYNNPKNAGGKLTGFDYQKNKDNSFTLEKEDIVVSAYQAQSHLLKVLFEPKSKLEDSLTYDATGWGIPYSYGGEIYAVKERIAVQDKKAEMLFENNARPDSLPYGYLATWKDVADVKFLGSLLQADVKIRYNELPFKLNDVNYDRGTLMILKADNEKLGKNLDEIILNVANQHKKAIKAVYSGFVQEGKDFGSDFNQVISKPKVALLSGEAFSATDLGEIWHYFEQDLNYPITVINMDGYQTSNFKKYDIIIVSNLYGSSDNFSGSLSSFVSDGGKVIAIGNAVDMFANNSRTGLNKQKVKLESEIKPSKADSTKSSELLKKYEKRERERLSEGIAGTIYKVDLDETHPLAFGEDNVFFLMKNNDQIYPYLPSGGWNVGTFGKDAQTSGFVGAKLKEKIKQTLAIGVENIGRGKVIYFADSPIFRGFWHSGKLLLGNAVFLVK